MQVHPARQHARINNGKTQESYQTALSMTALSDAQEMLAKARALREQAEADEHTLHQSLISKKQTQDDDTDHIIEQLFPPNLPKGQPGVWQLAEIMEQKRFSASCLEKVVERLHEIEISARGMERVASSVLQTHVKFEKKAAPNEKELARVEGLIQMLIDAAAVLDEKAAKEQEKGGVKHHVDVTHWCSGNLSEKLSEKAHFLGREHDEQFKGRMEEYYKAARKKKGQKNDHFEF